jgi:hypothetical protein
LGPRGDGCSTARSAIRLISTIRTPILRCTQRSRLPRKLANQKSYCNRRAAKRRQPPHHATLPLEFPSPIFPMMIRFSCRAIQSPAASLANKRLVEAAHGLGVEVLDRGLLPEAGIQVHALVIPVRCAASNYDVLLHIGETRDSGSGATHHPGMTAWMD